jgi:hypothetical protein
LTLGYTVGSALVTLNGVMLEVGSEVTATSGTSVVLASGATAGDELNVYAFSTFNLADVYTKAQSDARYPQIDTDTLYVDATNNRVGIGTSSPTEKLHVTANIRASNGSNQVLINGVDGSIEIARTAGNPFIDFKSSIAEDYDCRIQQVSDGLAFLTGGDGASPVRVQIDNAGRVTMPYQPAFSALRTTSNNFGGSFGTVGGLTAYFNTGGHLNTTTGVFTAPVAGNYVFSFVFRGNDGSADADGVSARIIRNSTMYLYDIWGSPGRTQDGTSRNFVSGSVVMNMAAGDTAAFQANGTFLQGNFSGHLLS